MRKSLLMALLTILLAPAFGQEFRHHLSMGTQFPTRHYIAYEFQLNSLFSAELRTGLLVKPYDQAVLEVVGWFAPEFGFIDLIDESFEFGNVMSIAPKFNFGNNYIGPHMTCYILHAGFFPSDIASDFLGFDVTVVDPETGNELFLYMRSRLINVGLMYGRRWPLKNKKFEFRTEVSFEGNVWSRSKFFSCQTSIEDCIKNHSRDQQEFVLTLYEDLDQDLDDLFRKYVFIPSVSLSFVYKFSERTSP